MMYVSAINKLNSLGLLVRKLQVWLSLRAGKS